MRFLELLETLRAAVHEGCEAERVALAFSGGLDSSVIAVLAAEVSDVIPHTVGFPGAVDLANAQEVCEALGLGLVPIFLDDGALLREARRLLGRFPQLDVVSLSFELPLWVLLQRSSEAVVLAGQGADELFGGYARYDRMGREELGRALEEDLHALLHETVPRERAMARLFDREFRLPYCHPAVVEAALRIPVELRAQPRRKEALRQVAAALGLPAFVVERPKKAVQYGSGVMMRLKALARREGIPLRELLGLRSPG